MVSRKLRWNSNKNFNDYMITRKVNTSVQIQSGLETTIIKPSFSGPIVGKT